MTEQWTEIQTIRDLGFDWPPYGCPDYCIIKDDNDRVNLDATITELSNLVARERKLAADSQYFMSKYQMSYLDYDELKDNRSEHQAATSIRMRWRY